MESPMRAFPLSLKDAANDWFYYLPTGSITTWNHMKKAFLEKYFPYSLSSQLKKEIINMEQMYGENLYEYWERFKQLLASCPYHGYTDHDLLLNFCGGLLEDDARMIKATTQGGIEYMSVQEANDLIEWLVGSSRNFGRRIKKASVASSSKQNSTHMEDKVDFLTNLVKELEKGGGSISHVKFCGLCNDPTDPTDGCPYLQTEAGNEVVKALGFRKFDPYSNAYSEGWKAHANLGWGGNQNQNKKGLSKSSFQKPNQNQNQSQNFLEDMMTTLAANQVALQANTKEFQTAVLQQYRLTESRIGGSLPSHTFPPPTKEQAQAIFLRNGRELLEAPKAPKKSKPLPAVHEVEDVIEDKIELVVDHERATTPKKLRIDEPLQEYEPQAPFPSALNDTTVMDKETSTLYDIFHKVEVNIPLLDLFSSVPKNPKFLKELCTTKRINKAKSMNNVRASEHVSAMFQKRLPQKCCDLGMFTIPCKIGELEYQRAMLDLGASINVLPHYLYECLKLRPLKPTHVVISLADRSNIYPKGIIEDVLVKVRDMIFPIDFYVIEMEPEKGSTFK
ncbi:uncharacterized protein LOC141630520 [Silene latifolia]|uniref:uncharacterized protein LOC141630520 n=1 Tax=Silene latifolia TaxID=37657 RepID=UPI003D7751CF